MGTLISIIVLWAPVLFTPGEKEIEVKNYIETYKEIAVLEMYRTGVPASITMAQAIHESGTGKSALAVSANNHFGIKCKRYWSGQTYYHEDDDRDREGNLIASCFRAYESVFDSYVDHSNFLSQTAHYQALFELPMKDYEAWARGLKQAGYATDPLYAEKLIAIIEKYDLALLDYHPDPMENLKFISTSN